MATDKIDLTGYEYPGADFEKGGILETSGFAPTTQNTQTNSPPSQVPSGSTDVPFNDNNPDVGDSFNPSTSNGGMGNPDGTAFAFYSPGPPFSVSETNAQDSKLLQRVKAIFNYILGRLINWVKSLLKRSSGL